MHVYENVHLFYALTSKEPVYQSGLMTLELF